MSFVFVSHASPDKKKIRHIVDALIDSGIRVWLDKPQDMGYSADEVKRKFHRLRTGTRWSDEIDDALKHAEIVLVCFSERFNEHRRHVFRREATVARDRDKLIGCRVDDVDPGSLPDNFGAEQLKDLRADFPSSGGGGIAWGRKKRDQRAAADLRNAITLLIDDIKKKMFERRHGGAREKENSVPRDPFAPYLVDRSDQEDDVRQHIEEIAGEGNGVRPFFISGPENECVQEFRDRLTNHAVPASLGGGRTWFPMIVEWPTGKPPEKFVAAYRRRLADALQLPMGSDLKGIAGALIEASKPVAVASFLSPSTWYGDEPTRIKRWLSFWVELEEASPGFAAMPMLFMMFPEAEAGWRTCPPGRAKTATFSNEQIWGHVNKIAKRGVGTSFLGWGAGRKNGVTLEVPPVLHSINQSHVDTWIADHFKELSRERERAEKIKADLFRNASGGLVTLKQFAEKMKAVCRGEEEKQTL